MTAIEDARAALAHWDDVYDLTKPEVVGQRLANALGALIAEHEHLTAPPTDDEREALADVWAVEHGGSGQPDRHVRVGYPLADAVLAAGFRRQGPITDAKRLDCGCEVHEEIHYELPDQPTEVIPLFYCPKHAPITEAQVEAGAVAAYRAGASRYANMFTIGQWMRIALQAARDA
jgi:hypothetical protein